MNKKFVRNWAIVGLVVVVLAATGLAAQHYGLWPTRAAEEKGFDPIAAGDRIEEKIGLDVLHIGPIGGMPPDRELALEVVTSVLADYSESPIKEDTHLYRDLGIEEDDLTKISVWVYLQMAKMHYAGSLSEVKIKVTYSDGAEEIVMTLDEALTVGELADVVVEKFRHSIGLLGATPRFHIAVIFAAPDTSDDGTAVTISFKKDGPVYEILEPGEYIWDETIGADEGYSSKWSAWTLAKWKWYQAQGGLFPPGKRDEVEPAIRHLSSYMVTKAMTPWINAFISEAYLYEEATGRRYWRMVEVSYLMLMPPQIGFGVDAAGQPGLVAYREEELMGTRYLFRTRRAYTNEGLVPEIRERHLDRVFFHERRELTAKEVDEILFHEKKQASYWQSGMTLFGPLGYTYGYNHPWQGK